MHLSIAADLKDDDTGVHIIRIGYLAEALALCLGQSRGYASMLRKAAPMHDIGKIGIPDNVFSVSCRFQEPVLRSNPTLRRSSIPTCDQIHLAA